MHEIGIRSTSVGNFPKGSRDLFIKDSTRSNFAYAYIIAGCMPSKPLYRYYIYDILVSTRIQRLSGSTADVVVFVQMSYESNNHVLPKEDAELLQFYRIRIVYIEPTPHESFYRTMLDKFRVLQLTEYTRVLFMDSDVMPRASLDYLFHLSVKGILQETLVVAGGLEPANGGFFMLTPKPGSWETFLDVVRKKEERGKTLPYPHFDNITGWGHAFENGDYYELFNGQRGYTWTFYGAFADQGLLYHWCKYVSRSVSIVLRNKVSHWGNKMGKAAHVRTDVLTDLLKGFTTKKPKCSTGKGRLRECHSPYSDYRHFTGRFKPWLIGPPRDYLQYPNKSDTHIWFSHLHAINHEHNLGLNVTIWGKRPKLERKPLLG